LRRTSIFLTAAALLIAAGDSRAQQRDNADTVRALDTVATDYTRRTLTATRIAGARPVIDGRLDDAAWQHAAIGTGFVQLAPDAGAPASERTEIRVLYDDAALYVAARMYDSSPDSIVAQLARRDQEVYSDWIYVAIDSYFDRRTAFTFGVNPRGVKIDLILYDDTRSDGSWDAVWDVATQIDSLGWTAEFRIPFSQLRFSTAAADEDERTWGVNFLRKIARRNEESFWSPMRRDVNALVSVFGELRGLSGLQPPRRLEVQPYGLSRLTRAPGDGVNPFFRANDAMFDGGADLKYGLTSGLTLTATINPDFGQVEADPSVVNLSAFESFFPERRPFFVEGADIFRFGIGVGDGDGGNEMLFYSRRIGRAPQAGTPSAARWRDVPDAARILGAAKVSGKTQSGWSIGLLNATTGEVTAQYATAEGELGHAVVEPLTNYAVGRLIKDFRAGQSAVGATVTATNRDLGDDRLLFLRSAAYTGGLTARHRFGQGRYQLSAWLAGSHIRGDTLAMRIAQQSPARYFQRPEIVDERFDPARTTLTGWAGNVELLKLSGGHWRYGGILNARSPGFEVNDLGFQNNADQVVHVGFLGYDQYRPGKHFRQWNVNVNQWTGWTFDGDRIATGGNINGGFELPSYRGLYAGVNRDFSTLSMHALRGGPALRTQGRTNSWFNAYTDRRKAVSGSLNGNVNFEDGTGGYSYNISPTVRMRASNRMDLSLSPRYAVSHAASQYIARRVVAGQPYYVFGTLEQTTTSLTARLNYTFTPTLSLQLYAQPFISAGGYSGFKEVANPRAARYDDRFRTYDAAAVAYDADANTYRIDRSGDAAVDFSIANPDFNVKQFRSNAVLRWEYRPGSTLFLVWSQGRSQRDAFGDYSFGRDAGDLFASPATNVLLLKVNYWLGL
jgi:hypothetical protein